MTNQKSTKRALVLSFLALFVCVTMLIGTTFAWFTDSITSGRNKIQSGNLDVELYYALTADDVANDNWSKVTNSSDIFGYDLWEPGFTKVAYFKVVNEGSLALKYQLTADVYKETAGKNVAGEDFLLSDYIYTAIVDTTATRDSILAMNGTNLKNSIYLPAKELEKGESTVVGLALWMPTSVGNEANHDGENEPSIEFGINLVATQAMSESDSFGEDYDNVTLISNVTELSDAIDNGENVILNNDINLNELTGFALRAAVDPTLTITSGKDIVIDLNGYTLYSTSANTGKNYNMFDVKGTLTIVNGTVTTKHAGANMGWGYSTNVINVDSGGVVNLENVTMKNYGGSDMAIGIHLNNWGEVTLNANNTTIFSTYCGVRVFNSGYDMNNVNITNSTITASSSAFWVHNYTVADFGTEEKANAQAALLNLNFLNADRTAINNEANNTFIGKIRFGFTNSTSLNAENAVKVGTANDGATLNEILNAGGIAEITEDIKDAPVATTAPYGNKYGVAIDGGVLNGNGKVLDFNSPGGDNYGIMISDGTIKNVSVGGAFRGIVIMDPKDDVYIDNVIINDEDVCYALNTAEGNGTASVYVSNSTLCGWTSIGNVVKAVYFTNCSFGQGTYYTNVYGRLVKPYCDAVFENCDFSSKFYVDLSAFTGTKVVFKNCSVNGVKITADNWASMVAPDDTCADGQISVELKNGTYLSASNVADYFVIE